MTKRVWPPIVSAPGSAFRREPIAPTPALDAERERLAQVTVENERRRIERRFDELTRELDDMQRQVDLTTPRNRRYNVGFTFDWVDEAAPADPIYSETQSVNVNAGKRFYAMALEMHYSLQSNGATFALGPNFMRSFFDFEWRVRDTGSDREWSNDWMPSDFLYSGDVCGLLTRDAPALMGGNASIEVDVRVTKSANGGTGSFFTTIQKHILQLSFVGVEVPE